MKFLSSIPLATTSLLLFLLLPSLPARPGYAAAPEGFRVLTEVNGRAVQYHKGALDGWGVEIVHELMERTGCKAEIEPQPWARAYGTALTRPNVVIFPITRTEERDALFHWVGPLFRVQWSFFARKGSGIVINSLDDARKVGSIGTYFNDARDRFLLDQGFTNLDRSSSDATNYRKLEYGRLDLIVGSNTGLAAMADAEGIDPDNFEEVFPLKEVDLYLALSLKTDPEVVAAWQEALRQMREDGTLRRVIQRWYPGIEPPDDVRRPWLDKN